MNKTTIDWQNPAQYWELDFTWNPIYGCLGKCKYCYARRLHKEFVKRFGKSKKCHEQFKHSFDTIQFFHERLNQPFKQKHPSTVFVGSMADIFWQTDENINAVLDICRLSPEHRFLFLTKRAELYKKFTFTENCWLGVTAESPERLTTPGMVDFIKMDWQNKFLSIEPLLGDFTGIDLSFVSWIVAGPQTEGKKKAYLPKWKKEAIVHDNIYWKGEV